MVKNKDTVGGREGLSKWSHIFCFWLISCFHEVNILNCQILSNLPMVASDPLLSLVKTDISLVTGCHIHMTGGIEWVKVGCSATKVEDLLIFGSNV